MRIAIDISPLSSGHKVRGVGSYVASIKSNIEKYDKENDYIFFEDNNIPEGADIIHYPYFDPFILTLPRKKPKKVIVTVHDLTPIVYKEHFPAGFRGGINWFIQKTRLRHADLIIADSESSKRDINRIVGIPEERIKVVYLAADTAFAKLRTENLKPNVKKKFNLPDEFLLYVGDATWNKNIPELIRAVKKTKFKLVMVGKVWERKLDKLEDNPWNNDLKYVLNEINGDDQFINLGFVETDDLVNIYNMATALVMPSIYEGFGLPVLEAMSSGCPVISTRGGSLPEVGGDAVLYAEGFDTDNLVKVIEKTFGNKDLREKLSKKGLLRAREFTIEKMIKKLTSTYRVT